MVEVATELAGQPPANQAKVRFVTIRTEAIEALTRQMLRSHDRWVAKTAAESAPFSPSGASATAASSFEPLDAVGRSGAITELEMLNEQLRRETADDSG